MAADEKAENISTTAGSPSGGNRTVMILTVVNLLATIGMVAVLFVSFQRDKKNARIEDLSVAAKTETKTADGAKSAEATGNKENSAKKAVESGKMVTLEQFTVNLSTPGSVTPKFVRVNISIEVPTEDAETELMTKMPQVRNTIIDLFNSKRAADLAGADGRDYLKDEIKNALNGFMVNGKVKGVFFTNFAVAG
jgi:flagellar protein FliL